MCCDPQDGCDGACGGPYSPYYCGFSYCEDCELTFPADDLVDFNGDMVCEDCAGMRREKEEESDE